MPNNLTKGDDEMADPMQAILQQMRTNPEDAAVIGQFLDIGVLVPLFRKHKYGAEKKVEVLLNIIDTGTPTQKMRAIQMLDQIWETALVRRGMLMENSGNVPANLPTGPVAAPHTVRSIEASQTTRRIRMTMNESAQAIAATAQPQQPLEEPDHGPQEKPETEGQDEDAEYFSDERGINPDIFRPPVLDAGQQR
jgi:hypothetical protein